MSLRVIAFALASIAYWLLALYLGVLAIGAPCGLAPGEWRDIEGPNMLGAILGVLGPFGVLTLAALIYCGVLLLYRRQVNN